MPTTVTHPRSTATHRWTAAAVALVLLAVLAAAANPVVRAVSGRSIGELMAEQSGQVRYDRYARPADVPAGVLPAWFPGAATAVTVVRPGPAAGGDGGTVRVDASVPDAMRLPTACAPSSSLTVPFPLPAEWPHYRLKDLRTCGNWTVLVRSGHLYLWGERPSTHP